MAAVETLALVIGLHAYLLFFRPSLAWDLATIGVAFAAVMALFWRRGETAASLGIADRAANARAARMLVPVVAAALAAAAAWRLAVGPEKARPLWPGVAVALLAYPLWGFLQQLFYLGFVQRGLARSGVPMHVAGVIAGALYGLVHAPNWLLTAATAPLGVAFGLVYARAPGLLAIGVAHGVAGAIALYVAGLDLEIGARLGRPPGS